MDQETLKKMTFIAACRTHFGIKPGQTLKDFADEVKQVTGSDRDYLVREFRTIGIDATGTA